MIVLRQSAFRAHEIGLSLVELMIAMVLGLAVVAGVSTLSLNASRSYRSSNQAGELIENGRYALRILKNDLEHAGFFGVYGVYEPAPTFPEALPDPCSTEKSTPRLKYDFLFPVVGYKSSPGSCTKIKNIDGPDILVIRRGGTSNIKQNESAIGDLLSEPSDLRFKINNDDYSKDIRKYYVNIYYIAINERNIPTLYRFSPTDNNPVTQPIVDGIENLRLMFGVDGGLSSDSNCTPVLPGDGAPDCYYPLDSFTNWKDWYNVVAVRLDLLARTTESDPNYTDAKTYSLGNVPFTPTEKSYRRRVYSQVVRLVNVSGRREK